MSPPELSACPSCGHSLQDDAASDADSIDADTRWAIDELHRIEADLPEFPTEGLPWHWVENEILDVRSHLSRAEIMEKYGVGKSQFHVMRQRRKWNERRAVIQQLLARRAAKRANSHR